MMTETTTQVVSPIVYENIHSIFDIETLLREYKEDQKLPDDIPEALDAAFDYVKKKRGKEKSQVSHIMQEWIDFYESKIGRKVYNQIIKPK